MTLLTAMEPLARPYIKDCPRVLVHAEMLRAAREFCEKTHAWRESRYVGFGANLNESTINAGEGNAFVATISARKKGETTKFGYVTNPDDMSLATGVPSLWSSKTISKLMISPVPIEQIILQVEIALKPALTGTEIPDEIAETWGEGIADGAVYNLLMMEDTEWYNPDRASFHKNRFDNLITDARIKKSTGFRSGGSTRASGHKFI